MSTEFIGRERELANLRRHWEESVLGRPRLIICRGEAGIGKTRLATELTTWIRTRGGRTLWARALEARDAPPFWLWRQAFDDLDPVAEGHDRTQLFDTFAARLNGNSGTAPGDSNDTPGDSGSGPGESSGQPDGSGGRRGTPGGSGGALGKSGGGTVGALGNSRGGLGGASGALGGSGGTLLVIDDIHWADEPSLLALLHIVRGWREERIMVCATARDEIADSSDGWRAVAPELLREPVAHVLDLAGLSPHGSAACLSAAAERQVPESITAEAYAMSGGNPFYLRELGRGLRDRRGGSGSEELRLPATLREVVRGRLATLPPRAQELLRAAAILDDEFSVAVAARLIGRPALDCLSALDAAAASGLLVLESPSGTVRFTHALVRAALHEGLPLQQRVLLHARAARAIEDLYPDTLDHHAAALARHCAESAVVGDRAPAVEWARRAGDNALRELAFEEAARLYGIALEHATGLPIARDLQPADRGLQRTDRGRLLVARALAHLRAGHLDPAHEDCVAARAQAHRTGDITLLAENALVLEPVGNLLWDRDIHQWCTEALATGEGEAVEPGGDGVPDTSGGMPDGHGLPDVLRARLLARLTEAGVYLGYWTEADETSSAAVELADRCGDDEALVAALRARQLACTGPEYLAERAGLAGRMIEIGVRTGRPGTELWGRLWAIDNHWESGDIGGVETELARLRWCARHTGGPMATWHVLIAEAAVAQARGELDTALRVAERARELAETLGHPAGFGAFRSLLGNVGHHRGHSDESLEVPPDAHRGEVRNRLFMALGPAQPLSECGRLDEAAVLYRSLGPPQQWEIPPFFRLVVLAVGGSIAMVLGITADLEWFVDQFRPYRDRHVVSGAGNAHYFGPVALWLGKFAAVLDDPETAERELRAAREICRANGAKGYVVESECELAELLLSRGATEEALALAKGALPQSESIGMPPWTERLRRIIAEASARAVLSPREREVAELVAKGLSNREIAAALVLSERTAQNHVQHILTKLGFTNRAQIVAWVSQGR